MNKIFKIGVPSSLSMLIMSLGLFLMNSIFIDDSHVAAYNLANRIENFIVLALISISTSQVTIIGMFYGAKKNNLIKPMIRYTTLWAILIASFFSIVTFLFIEDIAPLFLTSTYIVDNIPLNIGERCGVNVKSNFLFVTLLISC